MVFAAGQKSRSGRKVPRLDWLGAIFNLEFTHSCDHSNMIDQRQQQRAPMGLESSRVGRSNARCWMCREMARGWPATADFRISFMSCSSLA